MSTALQRKDYVDPMAALMTDRGNLCDAKDHDRRRQPQSIAEVPN
ncbi:hypothetical protein [Limnohabitans sp.]